MVGHHERVHSVDVSKFAVADGSVSDEDGASSNSSYAGSGESLLENEFSPVNYLEDCFTSAFDPSRLDRAIATQAQTSGMINAKSSEIEHLQLRAQQRLKELKEFFVEGVKNAKAVQKDLEWIQRRATLLTRKAKTMYPIEYNQALEQIKPDYERE